VLPDVSTTWNVNVIIRMLCRWKLDFAWRLQLCSNHMYPMSRRSSRPRTSGPSCDINKRLLKWPSVNRWINYNSDYAIIISWKDFQL
jgi:hypothetical protein